jgi:hypothetical protein
MLEMLAIQSGLSFLGGQSQKAQAKAQLRTQKIADSKEIVRDRLQASIRNAYATSLGQMQLALQKKQTAQQMSSVRAGGVQAAGEANLLSAYSGTMGASVDAVSSDILQRSNDALTQLQENYDASLQDYNRQLDLMVLNTDLSKPEQREYKYMGPSTMDNLLGSLAGTASGFAGNYATQKMKLDLSRGVESGMSISSILGF